ncbi:MAG: EAL domain-containing protein, partial [Methyloprofundus sp.]|nr:EAL domain-containing protein [Methyloprofundus sp.]
DLAMYKAKDSGRNNYSFFTESLSTHLHERTDKISALTEALENKSEFELLYQPKVSADNEQKITGVEALIRWHSNSLGFVQPDQFIPLAEETGLIVALGEWILLQACRDFLVLKKQGGDLKTVSINVSNIQFQRSDMISTLEKIIADTGIAPSEIELEITESYLASDENSVPEILQKIRKMGIKIAIDDFGTGYSSMSYLHKLPITRVKIDKAFVDGLPDNKGNLAISRAIIGLAKAFDLLVTAEGVETELQRQCLENEKCDEIQGYIYSKPLMLDELKSYIDSRESIAALA